MTRALGWARLNLFNGVVSSIATLIVAVLIAWGLWEALDWGVIHAVWSAPDGRTCRALSNDEGACWAFVGHWYRFIVFGRYPYAEHWRPALVIV